MSDQYTVVELAAGGWCVWNATTERRYSPVVSTRAQAVRLLIAMLG